MSLEFFHRQAGVPARLAVLPGAFNPPTRAHIALAAAALSEADEVLFVLPRVLPHKSWDGPGFADRARMLLEATRDESRFSVAASGCGLFAGIAEECREAYPNCRELKFICGRDAAERIVNWDYGAPGAFDRMLRNFELRVACRLGDYEPPERLADRIRPLTLPAALDEISSTEVRRRVASGEPWAHLVPEPIVHLVRDLYQRAQA